MATQRALTETIADGIFGDRRGGRPKLPPGEVRSRMVWGCVTDSEEAQVFRRAAEARISVSEYIRTALGFSSKT